MSIPVLYSSPEECCGCMACVNICPKNAIVVREDVNGFTFPVINSDLCIGCNSCIKVCDFKKTEDSEINRTLPISCYAVVNRNKKSLDKSASGGVFPAVADWIRGNGGVVVGCIMEEGFIPKHICSDKEYDINRMRGSKYVQSEIGHVYREVNEYLKNDRYVLFTGTPCQVAGLYSFLGGKDKYEKLYTVDLICHGVPNARNMRLFLNHISKREGGKVKDIIFRSKNLGWGKVYANIKIEKGKKVSDYYMWRNEEYFIDFLDGHLKRDADFKCKYASAKRVGDMTMGDFWGWLEAGVNLNWSKGLSVLFVNTKKAENIFDDFNFEKQPVTLSQTLSNPTLSGREKIPAIEDREKVLRLYRENRLDLRYPNRTTSNRLSHWLRYHIPVPIVIKSKEKIKKILKLAGLRK